METRRLSLESLEERRLMAVSAGCGAALFFEAASADTDRFESAAVPEPTGAKTWIVTTTATDMSSGSFRYAMTYSSAGDTIVFDSSLDGNAISLAEMPQTVAKKLTIDASSLSSGIIFNLNSSNRAFLISSAVSLTLKNISITNGKVTGDGGAIWAVAGSTLNLYNCTFRSCSVTGNGGAICSLGKIYAESCKFLDNSADANGGAIYAGSTSVELHSCLIASNTACASGGGIYTPNGGLYIYQSTITQNTANMGGGIYVAAGNAGAQTAVYNCIIINNKGAQFYYHDLGYNDVQSPPILNAYSLTGTDYWTETDHAYYYDSAQPLFNDPSGGDYTLAVDSQALDKGNYDYVWTLTDLAGNDRVAEDVSDLGAYETQTLEHKVQLSQPAILTGTGTYYVSCGLNRHRITWSAVSKVSSYELCYSEDGSTWDIVSIPANETSVVITDLTYGALVRYKVRALGDQRGYSDSAWSETKSFYACPGDIDGDDFIGPGDLAILSNAWFTSDQDAKWVQAADIDGNGIIAPGDRSFLSTNWFKEASDPSVANPAVKSVFDELEESFFTLDFE